MSYFDDTYIGQEVLKRKVSFKLDAYKKSRILRPTLITGPRGMGKTELVYQIGANITDSNGQVKPVIEIGCQSIKNLGDFISDVINPHTQGTEERTIFLEEVHLIPNSVMGFLLQVFNNHPDGITSAQFDGQTFGFDLRKTTWLMATTNPEQIVKPLIDRCINRWELSPYTISELGRILLKDTPGVEYTSQELVEEIARYGRNNPRLIFEISDHINDYCKIHEVNTVSFEEWDKIVYLNGINPYNLSDIEVITLHILASEGAMRVTNLASKLQLDMKTVRGNTEKFLIANNLIRMRNDSFREISPLGRTVLSKCDLTKIKERASIKV